MMGVVVHSSVGSARGRQSPRGRAKTESVDPAHKYEEALTSARKTAHQKHRAEEQEQRLAPANSTAPSPAGAATVPALEGVGTAPAAADQGHSFFTDLRAAEQRLVAEVKKDINVVAAKTVVVAENVEDTLKHHKKDAVDHTVKGGLSMLTHFITEIEHDAEAVCEAALDAAIDPVHALKAIESKAVDVATIFIKDKAPVSSQVSEAHKAPEKYSVKTHGVKMSIYTNWIKEELEREEACLELPMTMTLLISFSFMALLHLQQDQTGIVENAITQDITENANFAWAHAFGHKGIEDVNSYADFWSWTRLGLLPLLTASWGYSEALGDAAKAVGHKGYSVDALPGQRLFPGHQKATPVRNDYLRYNRIIGGIRMRQMIQKASFQLCTFPSGSDAFDRWYGKPCSPSSTGELPPDLDEADAFHSPERVEWILTESGDALAHATTTMVDMEDACTSARAQNRTCLCKWCATQTHHTPWLNEVTTRVEIAFIVMNPNKGLYSYVSINFWFNRAGHIYKLINIRSSWVSLFYREQAEIVMLMCADSLWALTSLYVMCVEGREVITIIAKTNKVWYRSVCEDYMAFWNVIDWISISLALTILVAGLRLQVGVAAANAVLGDFAKQSLPGNQTDAALQSIVNDFYDAVDDMLGLESAFRFQLVLYPSVLMLRLFKSFAAQPRLAIVTLTFTEASSDIAHFFIVFFAVYICMAVNAVLFFGQDSVDFATMGRAFHSCFLAMFGDWDYETMEGIGRRKAALWFWMFMIIIVLILQNIMLAILMEAYGKVKLGSAGSKTLYAQIENQFRRWRQARKKQRVRLNDIFDAILESEGGDEEAMLNNEKLVFPGDILKIVPNLKEAQAVRTLTDSQKEHEKSIAAPFSMEDMRPNIDRVKARMDNSLVCSAFIDKRIQDYDEVEGAMVGSNEQEPEQDEQGSQMKRSKTIENTGAVHGASREDDFARKRSQLEEGLGKIRVITQKSTAELSEAMESVLAEEMQALERRQKEQHQSMAQMQASLQSLRSLAHRLATTCSEVSNLTGQLTSEPRIPTIEEPSELQMPEPEPVAAIEDG